MKKAICNDVNNKLNSNHIYTQQFKLNQHKFFQCEKEKTVRNKQRKANTYYSGQKTRGDVIVKSRAQ